jgi:hypothetical protein
VDPLVADLTLAEVRALQRRYRRRAAAVRFPLSLSGVITLVAAGWALEFSRYQMVAFYGPALVAVVVVAGWRYRRISALDGVQVSLAPWALAALALLTGSALISRLGVATETTWVELAGPSLVFAVGYSLLGVWGRNVALVAATAILATDSLIAPLFLRGDPCVAWQCGVFGGLLVAAALRTRPVTEGA